MGTVYKALDSSRLVLCASVFTQVQWWLHLKHYGPPCLSRMDYCHEQHGNYLGQEVYNQVTTSTIIHVFHSKKTIIPRKNLEKFLKMHTSTLDIVFVCSFRINTDEDFVALAWFMISWITERKMQEAQTCSLARSYRPHSGHSKGTAQGQLWWGRGLQPKAAAGVWSPEWMCTVDTAWPCWGLQSLGPRGHWQSRHTCVHLRVYRQLTRACKH